jgi:nitrogen fixation/metabolism regulation signal transduction histidine kinase
MRIALATFGLLGGILLLLLAQASGNTALFAEHYPWLLAINGIAAAALLALVVVQVVGLWRAVRRGVFGSRLKLRLLLMLALMAVLPGVLVYAVSMQFAVRSIDSWFDVRVDAALEGGLNLGRSVLDTLQGELLDKTRAMALDLDDGKRIGATQLNRLREQAGAQSAAVLSTSGQVLVSSSGELGRLVPPLPTPPQLREARSGRGLIGVIEGSDGRGLVLRALVPLNGGGLTLEPNILQVTTPVPESIANSAQSVEVAHRDFQELQLAREGLKRIYTLTLTLALLLALFAAIALAFFLAERLVQPLMILAEGTRAVAAGDFTPRATVESSDELGVLTHSFSSMTQQLGEARAEAERRRDALEAAQAYLESVLANLSAGVLAFDPRFRLRAANTGALTILGDDLKGFEQLRLEEWPRLEPLAGAILENFAKRGPAWQEQIELAGLAGASQSLLLRGKALPEAGGGGFVVVFDDITQLIAGQRSAAWGEVAQRLAHEIKNPLTPIQLSAERLQMKLAEKLDDSGRALLERATKTIVDQVDALKRMVNDFRDYARTPPPQLVRLDLNALLADVVGLHENGRARIAVSPAPTFHVLADATQLRQVLHNLLVNAQDALTEVSEPSIRLKLDADGVRAHLTVADNGPGFAPQIIARAFEPYVTTKSRGTGLGLAIVRKIIDDHGGEVRVANHEGGEIQIWLPLAAHAASGTEVVKEGET